MTRVSRPYPGLVLLALVAASPVAAEVLRHGMARPIEARIEGYVGEKPADVVADAKWVISCEGKKYPFHVIRLRIVGGDVSPMNVLTAAAPYPVTFYLRADTPTLAQFAATPAGQKITLIAFLRLGGRQLYVGQLTEQ